jgi:uncharacterized RDD family membrane protein YckC
MAMIYDGLLSLGVLFVFTLGIVLIGGGEAIGADSAWFTISLLMVVFVFFAWSWTHGGQTLGMRSWRMRVVRADGAPVGWTDALRRYAVSWLVLLPALFGLWWALVDRQGMTLQDRWSGTRTELLPKA